MSRSGYSDGLEQWSLIRWRGAVTKATKGKRGQAFLKDLLAALDAMEPKRLIPDVLIRTEEEVVDMVGTERPDCGVCAIGSLGVARDIDMSDLDVEEPEAIAQVFDIAPALVQEIEYMNDEWGSFRQTKETPEERWVRMRAWVADQINE